jgi:type IX secretion system PorP/SprF family membrane protein
MEKKAHIYLFILFLISLSIHAQQDDQLSQTPFNPLAVNPAFAGSKGGFSGVVSARNQWTGFDGAPKTVALSLHTALKNKKMGLGLRLRDEKNVFDQKLEASICYAYRLKLFNGNLGFGISAGITNINYNWFNVEFKDKDDKYAGLQKTHVLLPRVDAGLLYNNKKTYISLSGAHLFGFGSKTTDPAYYNSNLSPHLYFIYSRAFKVNDNFTLNPAVNIKWVKANNPSIDLNMYANIKETLWLGVGYRTNNTLIFLAQIIIDKKYKLGYSYDYFMNQKTLGQIMYVVKKSACLFFLFNL